MLVTDFIMAPNCRDEVFEVNHSRLYTYLNARGSICGTGACSDGLEVNAGSACWTDNYSVNSTGTVLTPQTFSTPTADTAPWYDPAFPESARFMGFYLLDVTGLDSVLGRDVKTRTVGQGGGSLGPLRAKQRTMVFKMLAFGCDDTALDYAMRWLIDILSGQCDACGGCNAWIRFSCPDSTAETPLGVGETLLERWKQNRWELKNVALTDGPHWGPAPIQDNTCRVRSVEFTLVAADPYLYKDEVVCTAATTWVPGGTPACLDTCTWVNTIVGHSYQVCCFVNSSALIGETIINVSIYTGSSGLAELDLIGRVPNLDDSCPLPTDPNATLYTLKLANIPAGVTVNIDAANQRITTFDGTNTYDSFDLVDVTAFQTFGFPGIARAKACFCGVVSACSVASDATITISTQYRVL